MSGLRKTVLDGVNVNAPPVSPDAFEYQQDITAEAVQWLQAKADAAMLADGSADDEWVVVDGLRSFGS